MNGSNGIVPTVDLATNNTYPYPVMYGNSGFGNSGFFGSDGIWAIVLLALLFNGGWGGFGTIGEVSGMYPNNTLLITTDNHIVCSINGVVYDTFDPREKRVTNVWLVK